MHFLNFYVSHGTTTKFLRGGEKYYIYFVDNLLLFPTVKKKFQNQLTFDEVIAKIQQHVFFETQCISCLHAMHCSVQWSFHETFHTSKLAVIDRLQHQ